MGLTTMKSNIPETAASNAATEDSTTSIQAEAINSYLAVEERLSSHKKAKLETNEDTKLPVLAPAVTASSDKSLAASMPTSDVAVSADAMDNVATKETSTPEAEVASSRCGRWSLDEKLMFLYGLSLFGKGRWKKIHAYVPNRSLVQIKSHAQKVLKRIDVGENVFRRLEDNRDRLRALVHQANEVIRNKESKNQGSKKKRKRASTRKSDASASYTAVDWDNIQDVDVDIAMDFAIRRPKDAPFVSPGLDRPPLFGGALVKRSHSPPPVCTGIRDPRGNFSSQLRHSLTSLSIPSASTGAPLAAAVNYSEGGSPRSSYYGSPSHSPPSELAGDMPSAGTGAVIAAVAALCQLSAAGDL